MNKTNKSHKDHKKRSVHWTQNEVPNIRRRCRKLTVKKLLICPEQYILKMKRFFGNESWFGPDWLIVPYNLQVNGYAYSHIVVIGMGTDPSYQEYVKDMQLKLLPESIGNFIILS